MASIGGSVQGAKSRFASAAVLVMGAVLAMGIVLVPDASTRNAEATTVWQNANVSMVSVGDGHTCAIQRGVLFCWGAGTQGQLGYTPPPRPPVLPQPTNSNTPTRVSAFSGFLNNGNVTTVSAGSSRTCAIENGILYCWGSNGQGQLGNGRNTQSNFPAKVSAANGFDNNGQVTDVWTGDLITCAIESGEVFCWGANGMGGVGDGTTEHRNVPRKVLNGSGFVNNGGATAVTTGMTSCVIKAGIVYCWGSANIGQIGNGSTTPTYFTNPVKVSAVQGGFQNNGGVTAVSSAGISVCAVENLRMYCWGANGYGNGGVGVQVPAQTTARPVSSVPGGMTNAAVTSASMGTTACAVDAGIVYCAGLNYYGTVGDGTTTQRFLQTKVLATGGMQNNGAVTMVSSETNHACALELGSVYCWGQNDKGQMGNGTTGGDQLTPSNASVSPGAPTITGATVGTTTATVTVSAGPGAVPTGYTVTAQPGGGTCTVTPPATSCTVEGLTPGTAYTFTAVANSAQGNSPASAGVTRTTGNVAVPGTPQVEPGDGQLRVTPTPGSGGGTPTGYIASASPGGQTCTVLSPATSCVISPLTDGTVYTVTTAAFNDAGPSGGSAAASVAPGDPAAPQAPTVVVGDRTATVSVVPAAGGGGTPSAYTVNAQPGNHTCTVTPPATSCALSGLTNGTTYTFTTTATNPAGTSGSSSATNALVDILPVPLQPVIEVGATGVTVSVSSLQPGGTVQSYEVYLEPGGHRCTIVPLPADCFIDGLSQGTTYTVTTTATNGIGTSSASPARVFDFSAPGDPQIGVVSVAAGQLTVTVSAGTPGGPPTTYLVTATPSALTCTVPFGQTSCTITGLTGGQTYTVTASATNVLGTSTNSASAQGSLVAPDAPPAPTVEVGNGSATVSVAPATSGGIPSSYVVVAQPGNHTCTVTPPATSCLLTGLTNGTSYTVTTSATNDFGTSPSSPSTPALVDVTPSTPNEPSVQVGSGGVTVSVSSPTGGGSTQSYTVYVEPGGHTCTVSNPSTTPSCFVPLPSNGTYTVTTSATNTTGTSGSSPSNTFQFNAPAAPQISGVTIGLGQVTVSVAPGTGGGSPQSFAVFAGPGTCTVVPPATSCSVTGLSGGQTYTVTASATNGVGTTPNTTGVQARLIPPNAPPAPTVQVDDRSATVFVVPPTGGEDPSGYTVTAQPGNHTCTVTPPEVSCVMTGLTNGTQYTFTVVASNAYGPSPSGAATLAMVAEPPTPQAPSVLPGNGRATVTVNPGTGGGVPSVYLVSADPDGVSCEVTPPETSCVLEPLVNDLEYTITVRAANGVGTSTSSASTPVTPRAPNLLPPGIGNLIAGPVPMVPPTTPSSTVPTTTPTTTVLPPSSTVPPVVDPATGVLPVLPPGEVTVIVNGQSIAAQVEMLSSTEIVLRSDGFELVLAAECASACEVTTTPDGRPVIELEEGGGVRVNGTGFRPGTLVYVWLFSEPRLLGTVTVNADGTFSGTLPLGDLEQGEHTLQVNGSSAAGAPRSANLGVLVTEAGVPTPGPGRLPATGNGAISTLLTWAVVFMLVGAVTLVGRRRPTI